MGSFLSRSSSFPWQAEGRTVLITGASRGIGAQLARVFAREKVSKLVLVARSKDDLEKVAEECRQLGSSALEVEVFRCDLTNNSSIKSFVEAATKSNKGFDVVILNAGRSQGCYFEEIEDIDQIDYMIKLNVNGVINTLHYILPQIFKSRQSRIIIISSAAGLLGSPYRTVYCASKHALTGFCNSFRIELKDSYEADSPVVSLINIPEVRGTDLNSNRMDFGSKYKPMEFDPNKALELTSTCQSLYEAVAAGKREWGQPMKLRILKPLYDIFPGLIDGMIMKYVRSVMLPRERVK